MSSKASSYLIIALISCFPVLEIWIIVELINAYGGLATLALVLASTIGGLVLNAVFARKLFTPHFVNSLEKMSKSEKVEAYRSGDFLDLVMLLGSTLLLITPGFLSDLLGVCFLFRPIGRPIAKGMLRTFDQTCINSSKC